MLFSIRPPKWGIWQFSTINVTSGTVAFVAPAINDGEHQFLNVDADERAKTPQHVDGDFGIAPVIQSTIRKI
jgi:hypothetical protein